MQQIERYGVIALVFLLVTIVAVSFWGDSKSPGFWSRLTGRGAKKEATADSTANMIPPAASTERAIDGSLPLTANDAGAANGMAAAPAAPGTNDWQTPGYAAKDPWTSAPTAPPEIAYQGTAPATGPSTMSSAIVPPAAAPGPRVQPAPSVSNSMSTGPQYVVQKGDSLIRIAARTLGSGSRWTEIQSLNAGLDPRSLRPGMKIVLPASAKLQKGGSTSPSSPPKRATKSGSSGSGTYVVRSGDTLTAIAARTLGDRDRWRELVSANPGLDPKRLHVGQSIRVPGATTDGARSDAVRTAAARPSATRAPVLANAEPRSAHSDRPRVR